MTPAYNISGEFLGQGVELAHADPRHACIDAHPEELKYVHQAVLDNKENETGITIHYVNEHYDEGGIIFQKSVSITDCSTFEDISKKVHQLEQKYFPEIIDQLLSRNL